MNDKYNERLVKGRPAGKDYLYIVLSIIGIIASLVLTLTISTLFMFLMAIMIYLTIVFFRNLKVEYEYIITAGTIDVAKITNASKRKEICSVDPEKITLMTLVSEDKVKNDLDIKRDLEVLDFTDGGWTQEPTAETKMNITPSDASELSENSIYVAVYDDDNGKKRLMVFDFNASCIEHMKMYLKQRCEIRLFSS